MTPIRAACDRTFTATRHSGTRPVPAVKLIVLHDAEALSARGVAQFFASSAATGSTHLTVDDASCYRTLRNEQVPWAAPGANEHGFHIEQCGFARWNGATWLRHQGTLRRAAYKTALHAKLFRIPLTFLTADELRAFGKAPARHPGGITTHAECSQAFGGDHTDPGAGWPRRTFMGLVRFYANTGL